MFEKAAAIFGHFDTDIEDWRDHADESLLELARSDDLPDRKRYWLS